MGLLESIPLWAVTLLAPCLSVLSLVMILTVYSRFFKLYMATAIALSPWPVSRDSPPTASAWPFSKATRHLPGGLCHCIGLCDLLGLRLGPARHHGQHPGACHHCVELYRELIFNMLVLVGAIKMSDDSSGR